MTSFVQGQPFNTGPIFDQMRFGSEQTTGTMPLTGSYMDVFNMLTRPEVAETFGKLPKDIQGIAPLMLMVGAQGADAQRAADARFERTLAYQREASERADAMGVKNQIIGSFLKDVPAAIGGFARAPLKFADQRIQMADNFAARGPSASAAPRNYYGFVG